MKKNRQIILGLFMFVFVFLLINTKLSNVDAATVFGLYDDTFCDYTYEGYHSTLLKCEKNVNYITEYQLKNLSYTSTGEKQYVRYAKISSWETDRSVRVTQIKLEGLNYVPYFVLIIDDYYENANVATKAIHTKISIQNNVLGFYFETAYSSDGGATWIYYPGNQWAFYNYCENITDIELTLQSGLMKITIAGDTANRIMADYKIRINNNDTGYFISPFSLIYGLNPTKGFIDFSVGLLETTQTPNHFLQYEAFVTYAAGKTMYNPVRYIRNLISGYITQVHGLFDVGFIISEKTTFSLPYIDPFIGIPYWEYYTSNVSTAEVIPVFVGDATLNFTYDFLLLETTFFWAKFYYYPETIKQKDWGDWGWVWEWLHSALRIICNTFLLIGQFILYLLTMAFNFLIIVLIIGMLVPFFWNVVIFYLIIGFLWILLAIINLVQLIGQYLPYLIMAISFIFAYVVSALIWVVTLGTIPFDQILNTVLTMTQSIATQFTTMLYSLFEVLPTIVGYAGFYVILLGLAYVKYIYVKARGFVNRAEQAKAVYQSYLSVIQTGKEIVSEVKELIF